MDTLNLRRANDFLLDMQNQLCKAFAANNLALALELSSKIDAFQLSMWTKCQRFPA